MQVIFKLPTDGDTIEQVVNLPEGMNPRQIDNLFIDWLVHQTSASWEEYKEDKPQSRPKLKVIK